MAPLPNVTATLPLYSSKRVYEPSEDTFLFLDVLQAHPLTQPSLVLEIGPGSGVLSAAVAKQVRDHGIVVSSDVSAHAACATTETMRLNDVAAVSIVTIGSLGNHFRSNIFDLVLFNPPYVPSDEIPSDRNSIDRAWAGGRKGTQVTEEFLVQLPRLLSSDGVCLLLLEERNEPEALLQRLVSHWALWECIQRVKVPGEKLSIWRIAARSLGT